MGQCCVCDWLDLGFTPDLLPRDYFVASGKLLILLQLLYEHMVKYQRSTAE